MRTEDAIPILKAACNVPFKDLFKGHPADLITNKGHAGQLLERLIGLRLGNQLIDFEDGELKTNKASPCGDPMETIAVTQIRGIIDTLLADPHCNFEESPLCKKLDNLLVIPVVKDGPSSEWYLVDVYHIDLKDNPRLKAQFAEDYALICSDIRRRVSDNLNIRTSNGRTSKLGARTASPIGRYFQNSLVERSQIKTTRFICRSLLCVT